MKLLSINIFIKLQEDAILYLVRWILICGIVLEKKTRFCLSYDSLKWDFIAFKMNIIS